ncbi:MAG: EF-hand domain-containing protein, partial [archaeon]|nr:EF-hand domain-containing protein [archaeon]
MSTDEQIAQYTEVFNFLDEEKRGELTIEKLEQALGMLGKIMRKKELEDLYGTGKITLEAFLEICEEYDQIENHIIESFKILDPENTGYITKKDLYFILKAYQRDMSKKDIENIIKEANPDSEGKIDYVQLARDMLGKEEEKKE